MDRRMVEYEAKKQNPLVAYILLVVFGVVGAHNFYLGRRRQALAQHSPSGADTVVSVDVMESAGAIPANPFPPVGFRPEAAACGGFGSPA